MPPRDAAQRQADVRRLLAAARAVFDDRARHVAAIARSSGLTLEGVELGFQCLERDADDASLGRLIAGTADASRVHVVLSANVFVAPLRALAMARAASNRVTVRPSPRDPTLACALVAAAADPALTLVEDRDVGAIEHGEIHVYGRDATIAAVRARARSGVRVRGHGAGLGVAAITRAADIADAAARLAADVVAFDQRGCLSPRLAFVEGERRATDLAEALHAELTAWQARVPRGALSADEGAESTAWREALAFAGTVWTGAAHVVALAPAAALAMPPAGRHVSVVTLDSLDHLAARLEPIGRYVAAIGSDDPARVDSARLPPVRRLHLGAMQRPPLDGPVDLRR